MTQYRVFCSRGSSCSNKTCHAATVRRRLRNKQMSVKKACKAQRYIDMVNVDLYFFALQLFFAFVYILHQLIHLSHLITCVVVCLVFTLFSLCSFNSLEVRFVLLIVFVCPNFFLHSFVL